MTPAEQYRTLAAQLRSRACAADNVRIRAEWEHLAQCYIRLAEQADRNDRLDVTYEPILRPFLPPKPLPDEC